MDDAPKEPLVFRIVVCVVSNLLTGTPLLEAVFADTAFADAELRPAIDHYLQTLKSSEVRSLEDIVQWNERHPELQAGIGMYFSCEDSSHQNLSHLSMLPSSFFSSDRPMSGKQPNERPEQDGLLSARADITTPSVLKQWKETAFNLAAYSLDPEYPPGILRAMDELNLRFVAVCADGPACMIAALAGERPRVYLFPSFRDFCSDPQLLVSNERNESGGGGGHEEVKRS